MTREQILLATTLLFSGAPLLAQRLRPQDLQQNCYKNADNALGACTTRALNTYNTLVDRATAQYNDCVNPFSTSSDTLGSCYSNARAQAGDNIEYLMALEDSCDLGYLGGEAFAPFTGHRGTRMHKTATTSIRRIVTRPKMTATINAA